MQCHIIGLGKLARGFVKENSLVYEMCYFTDQQKTKKKETVHILYKTKYGNEIGNPEFNLHVHNLVTKVHCSY